VKTSDKFYPIPLRQLLLMILGEHKREGSIFGIPDDLFFKPADNQKLSTEMFGHLLQTPIGVAAGPHTQMSQNIIGAWLMGARYIELKTIQTLDELLISKPCIDMQDEGYNCEWSQELKVSDSFDEYLKAWMMIHILNHTLGWGNQPGVIFNMSVGYNLNGIMSDNVDWFLMKMRDCGEEIEKKKDEIRDIIPEIDKIYIPASLSDNITLSTMHGCPAGEIEEIARYLIEKKKLHTFVKLNPTLLGADSLREILNKKLDFKTIVPDIAFEHDLKYGDALNIIRSLRKLSDKHNLQFGLKLTNTLESVNNKGCFGNDVEMMYMSGRALHPISINVAKKLQNDFTGELTLSFSAGVDAFNIADVISCGFKTVTVCSDLLRPGGYMRLKQYFDELNSAFDTKSAGSIAEFVNGGGETAEGKQVSLAYLNEYADRIICSGRYRREYLRTPDIKTKRSLTEFDCISAPCRDTCSTGQDIPDYMYYTSHKMFDKAHEAILRTNPFPSTTGMVCDHLCQGKCTRINYDNPLQIREIKRFIAEVSEEETKEIRNNGIRIAVIGAGPSGLSCAYFLALAGFSVDVFESRSEPGGMVQFAIPGFRLTDKAIIKDINRITELGVSVKYNTIVDASLFSKMRKEYSSLFIGAGAQTATPFAIDGSDLQGVIDPLSFLYRARAGEKTGAGENIVIIGGGNTAMDAARTAWRLTGKNGRVTVIYRRTINEMPADQGEIKAVLEEGIRVIELASPEMIIGDNGKVKAISCTRMELCGVDDKGRPTPVKIEDSSFEIECDTIIPAIGQQRSLPFATDEELRTLTGSYMTQLADVYIGGDALRGASTAINAIADGRKAAAEIIANHGITFSISKPEGRDIHTKKELIIKKSIRQYSTELKELPLSRRKSFDLVSETINRDSAIKEAQRCLYCDELCNICVSVCPNFANRSYNITPFRIMLQKAALNENGEIIISDDKPFELQQQYQVLNIANFCNECGNCTTFCPTAGSPYKDKPRLFLTASAFNQAEEGYLLARLKDRTNIIFRQNNSITTLSELSDEYIYENDYVSARFSKEDFRLLSAEFLTPCIQQAHFERAVKMLVVLQGAKEIA